MNIKHLIIGFFLLSGTLLTACAKSEEPFTAPIKSPYLIPTKTLTSIPIPTNTLIPSPTPSVTPIPTATTTQIGCPGSPYSIDSINFKMPSDISPEIRDSIIELASGDPITRGYAIMRLGGSGVEATVAIPFLLMQTGDFSRLEWQASGMPTSPAELAIRAIGDIQGECAVKALITVLNSLPMGYRYVVADALGKTMHPDALQPLYELLLDPDSYVRSYAVGSLGWLAVNQVYDQNLTDTLIDIASNIEEDSNNRGLAADYLVQVAKDQTLELLFTLIKDPDSYVRSDAAILMENYKDPAVIEALISLLKDRDDFVKSSAATSLVKLTGQEFSLDYQKWYQWWKDNH